MKLYRKNTIFDIFMYILLSIFGINLFVKSGIELAYIILYILIILSIIGYKINQLLKEKNSH